MKNVFQKLFYVLYWIFLILGIALILIGTIGGVMSNGIRFLWVLYSPFNIANWFVTILILSPAFGCWWISEKLKGEG